VNVNVDATHRIDADAPAPVPPAGRPLVDPRSGVHAGDRLGRFDRPTSTALTTDMTDSDATQGVTHGD
jgi:hypothetical protein